MLHLLKIEWLKLNKYRAFKWLMGAFIISIFGINYVIHEFELTRSASTVIGNPFQFPYVWGTVSYFSSFMLIIPGLIMILIMSNEFSFRTHRQNIIDGLSRNQFISTKIVLVILFAVGLTILVFLTACIFGFFEGGSSFSLLRSEYIFYFFIQSIIYISVAMVFVLLLKRSGVSIGLYFLYAFVLENMFSGIINHLVKPLGYFLPLDSADKLIPIPIGGLNEALNYPNEVYLLLTAVVWISLCLWFCRNKFVKDDL